MACTSCGMPPGMEGFTDGKEERKDTKPNGQCLYTTQGEFVCNVNTEYDRWIATQTGNTKGKVATNSLPASWLNN